MPLGSVRGDTVKLAKLRQGLQTLGKQGFKDAMQIAAGRAGRLVDKGFVDGRDPDGAPWAPTVAGNRPLIRTGDLRAEAARVTATPRGLRVRTALPYAQYHLTGTSHMPARPYLPPNDATALPPAWQQMIRASVEVVLKTYLPS